jgi:hypothetical protein
MHVRWRVVLMYVVNASEVEGGADVCGECK